MTHRRVYYVFSYMIARLRYLYLTTVLILMWALTKTSSYGKHQLPNGNRFQFPYDTNLRSPRDWIIR